MNVNDLTIGEARQLAAIFTPLIPTNNASQDAHWRIGKNYFIRTVTHHLAGRLVSVTDKELVIENASWIAEDGRLTDVLKSCAFNEVEMFPTNASVIIGRGSLIDAVEITSTPTSQK